MFQPFLFQETERSGSTLPRDENIYLLGCIIQRLIVRSAQPNAKIVPICFLETNGTIDSLLH